MKPVKPRMFGRMLLCTGLIAVLMSGANRAEARRYFVGASGGLATLAGGDRPHFYPRASFGLEAGFELCPRLDVEAGVSFYRLYNDSTAGSSFSFDGDEKNATARFAATRLHFGLSTELFAPSPRLTVVGGVNGGLMIWKMLDPDVDTVLDVSGSHEETVDFSAAEVFLGGRLGTAIHLSPQVSLVLSVQADYLTGIGADFAEAVSSVRDRWLLGTGASLRLSFGAPGRRRESADSRTTEQQAAIPSGIDSDGDAVDDALDKCPDTPPGVVVDPFGCALDGDGDGIHDGRDHCPDTDVRARGLVDVYGCPVDSDSDGVPDYLDECPNNRQGAVVDSAGCPSDSDGDGVPDGIDDCPNTVSGVQVDRYGCLDLAMFDEPMVLNIEYASGSSEIDPSSRERLASLAQVLAAAPEIRLEINGYTDSLGSDNANRELSQKRADRVREFLAAEGIDGGRIRTVGRGASRFVATNDTAEGRAMNRRIEIVFHR